jgi:type II secretory pathway pseudopilin PulG
MKISPPHRCGKLNMAFGFTLLEVMIVLFLAVFITGTGIVVMMNRLPTAKLDATAREISAMMRQAKTLARIHKEKQTILIDFDMRSYGIEGKTFRKIPKEIQIKIDDFITGEIDKGLYRLIFSPFGEIDGGVVNLSTGRRTISIKPDPVVGFLITRRQKD